MSKLSDNSFADFCKTFPGIAQAMAEQWGLLSVGDKLP